MKFKIIAADPLYERLLTLELERMGHSPSRDEAVDYALLIAEGQAELPRPKRMRAAVLIDCGLLSATLPDKVKLLILNRPFDLTELRDFAAEVGRLAEIPEDGDPITLYPEELAVGYGEQIVKLTRREFSLFEYLHARPGETIGRAELLHELWQDEQARGTNVVDVYIKFLRTKLDDVFGVKLTRSIRGEGYVYNSPQRKDEQ